MRSTALASIATMSKRIRWSEEQRTEALALLAEHGNAEAARLTGIPAGTIGSWATRSGVVSPNPTDTTNAVATRIATTAGRKAALAEGLLDDVERLRARLFQPHVQKKAMTVSDGANIGSHVEVAEINLDQLPPADQRTLIAAIGAAIDKVQILTGEATERVEQLTGSIEGAPEARTQTATSALDELAQRRNVA